MLKLVFIIINLIGFWDKSQNSSTNRSYLVTRVIDGDTFEIEDGRIIRMIGINTPELPGQYYSHQAKSRLNNLINLKRVKIEFDGQGRYGRELGYVYVNGKSVNEQMIKSGHAVSYRKYPHEKTKKYNKIEDKAKRKKRGIWNR